MNVTSICCIVHEKHIQALDSSFSSVILTEWDEFKSYDWNAIAEKMMKPAKVFDGRNVLKLNKNTNQYNIGK